MSTVWLNITENLTAHYFKKNYLYLYLYFCFIYLKFNDNPYKIGAHLPVLMYFLNNFSNLPFSNFLLHKPKE